MDDHKVSYEDYLTAYMFALASDDEDFREAMECFDADLN